MLSQIVFLKSDMLEVQFFVKPLIVNISIFFFQVVSLRALSLEIWSQFPFHQAALEAKYFYITKFLIGVFTCVETSFLLPLLTALR